MKMKTTTLADFTRKPLCLPALLARDATDVLSELSYALERARIVEESDSLLNAARAWRLIADEDQIGSTAYAIGTLASITDPTFALARTRGCAWRRGASPVHLVFLIAAAPNEPRMTSVLVRGLQRLVADPEAFREMHAAANAAGMLSALDRITLPPHRIPRTGEIPAADVAGILDVKRRGSWVANASATRVDFGNATSWT